MNSLDDSLNQRVSDPSLLNQNYNQLFSRKNNNNDTSEGTKEKKSEEKKENLMSSPSPGFKNSSGG